MKKFALTAAALLIAALPALAGCSNTQDAAKPEGGAAPSAGGAGIKQEIRANLSGEPYTLDPAIATDNTSFKVINSLYEGLYTFDKKGEVVPGSAAKVDISPDGKTYTFTLRDNLKWSNGKPVTAKDFEYSWKRVLNPQTAATNAFYLYYIKGAEEYNKGKGTAEQVKATAKDDKTFVVELNAPTKFFPKVAVNPVFLPVYQPTVDANKNWAAEAKDIVSNGAYTASKWEHNTSLVLEKNDNYWNKDDVTMQTINYKMIGDQNTYYQMFKSGELDLIDTLPIDVLAQEKSNKDFTLQSDFSTYVYTFNVTQKPFTNAKIRRAFALAIDRESIVNNVSKGGQKPAYGLVAEGIKTPAGKDFREERPPYLKFDATEAKKLLAEGLKEENWATLPPVTLKYNTQDGHKKIAEALQAMFKENLGVDVKLENQEWKTYIDTFKQSNFQIARMSWSGTFLDPLALLDLYLGGSPNNQTKWVNPKYDELLTQGKTEQDENKRFEILHQAEDLFMQDLPVIPIYFASKNYLKSKNFEIPFVPNQEPNLRWAKKIS
ncbi:peptide ABC transporter substrate-binding protein [Paenibacillus tyrfis]|uniref:peptide ABC transporter substrate-binding protein n=1 Tax=Paenibacillus tyrfis TaxID=1501230 RepID=UPI0020A2054F|nr:peptide ABC transporter substrate-binding protein [Paenibacillus tyrfis]MCP1311323.1 peptide ABC transporter substrate-binding protein [Paenibacillus tyrfis]